MSERPRLVAGFVVSILAVALAYASAFVPSGPPGWAHWVMAAGVSGALATVMALGATRDGELGPLSLVFVAVFLVLVTGFGAALTIGAGDGGAGGLWLGLPPGAATILYGLGIGPLLLVPAVYAVTFDRFALDREDWERVRSVRDGGDRSDASADEEGRASR